MLLCISAGIALLRLNTKTADQTSANRVQHLLCWLLGHDDVKLGLCTSAHLSKGLADSWAASAMVQNLGSQLVELELCETGNIWQVLFQLRSLRLLRLSVVSQDASSTDEPPAERKLPQLTSLYLSSCTASVSPILVGTSLPQLKSLTLDSCNELGCINVDPGGMTGLETLNIKGCKQIKVSKMKAVPLEIGNSFAIVQCNQVIPTTSSGTVLPPSKVR